MPHNSNKKLDIKPLSKGSSGMDNDFDVPDPLPRKSFMITLIGERGSGKSVNIQNLINIYRPSMDYIFILSPSVFKNDDYDFIEEDPVFTNPNFDDSSKVQTIFKFSEIEDFPEIIKSIIDSNTDIILRDGRKEAPNILLILDDILEQGSKLVGQRSGVIEALSFNGRHSKVSCIVASQLFRRVSNGIRSNSDMCIFYSATNLNEVGKFIEEFCPANIKKEIQIKISKTYDVPYTFVCMLGKQIANRMKLKRPQRLFYKFDKPLIDVDFDD